MSAEEFIEEWSNDRDYIVVHTSGSTGKPKEINLLKSLMQASALATINFFGLNEKSRIHSCVAFDFIGGKMTAVRALLADCILTADTPSNRPALKGEAILNPLYPKNPFKLPIDLLSIVPSQIEYLAFHKSELPKVNNYLIGGSPLTQNQKRLILRYKMNAWESYGMTETASHIAIRRITGEFTPFECLPGINVRLDDRDCLVISRKGFEDVVTNDLAKIIGDNKFILTGRADDVIISGGKKFHPAMAEQLLQGDIPHNFYFTSRPDEKWGEAIVLMIEDAISGIMSDEEIMGYCSKYLEHWQMPKEIYHCAYFSRTPSGKIIRRPAESSSI